MTNNVIGKQLKLDVNFTVTHISMLAQNVQCIWNARCMYKLNNEI